jgi:hypothetical protein
MSRYPLGSLEQFARDIVQSWSWSSSLHPDSWTVQTPALGQALPTALLISLTFGGEVIRGFVDGKYHWWNILPGGIEVDIVLQHLYPVYTEKRPAALENARSRHDYETLESAVHALKDGVAVLERARNSEHLF